MSDVFEKASVTTELAHRMIAAAEAKATEMGHPDRDRGLRRVRRAEGVQPHGRRSAAERQIAQDKAYTAVGFGMPTDGWHDFIKDDPPLAAGAVGGIDRLVIFGGGYPIKVGDAYHRRRSGSVAATTRRTWRSPRRA